MVAASDSKEMLINEERKQESLSNARGGVRERGMRVVRSVVWTLVCALMCVCGHECLCVCAGM